MFIVDKKFKYQITLLVSVCSSDVNITDKNFYREKFPQTMVHDQGAVEPLL